MDKIDFVFPFVDMRDKVWQEAYKKKRRELGLPEDILKTRYRSWDNLKYVFRSIAKNAPWVGKVHLVVSNIEQIPDWVDAAKVNIVLHEDFIPGEYRPAFSSRIIETHLGDIPNLSERFVFTNDDIFILNPLKEEELFKGNVPGLQKKRAVGLNSMTKRMEWAELSLISAHFKMRLPNPEAGFPKPPHHTITPMLKETVRTVDTIFGSEIKESITPFREDKNFNQYLYTYYQLFSGKYFESEWSYGCESIKEGDCVLDKANDIARIIRMRGYDTLCINETYDFDDGFFETIKNIINSSFEDIFPDKCKYELP